MMFRDVPASYHLGCDRVATHCRPARDEEYYSIPQPLQRQDRRSCDVKLKWALTVNPAMNAVQAARDPRYQHTNGKQETRSQVGALNRVVYHKF